MFGAVALPTSSDDPSREEIIKAKERAILMLGETLSKYGFAEGMNLILSHRDIVADINLFIHVFPWLHFYLNCRARRVDTDHQRYD